MARRHLELIRNENKFGIKINSIVGRISLFTDNPLYKLKQAVDLKQNVHELTGDLALIKLRQKELYILEDMDKNGFKSQNFIFVSDELSRTMKIRPLFSWFKEQLLEFVSRSISVLFLLFYAAYYFSIMRYYNTMDTLEVLRYITGTITVLFAIFYYYLRSSKTNSSFLKVCFTVELIAFIVCGSLSNLYHFINSATDTL